MAVGIEFVRALTTERRVWMAGKPPFETVSVDDPVPPLGAVAGLTDVGGYRLGAGGQRRDGSRTGDGRRAAGNNSVAIKNDGSLGGDLGQRFVVPARVADAAEPAVSGGVADFGWSGDSRSCGAM